MKTSIYIIFCALVLSLSSNLLAAPSLSDGIDWSLPSYSTPSTNGEMIGEGTSNSANVNAVFIEVLWKLSEPTQGQFNWSNFQQR